MKINIISGWSNEVASSRIRVHTIYKYLRNFENIDVQLNQKFSTDFDVIILQKNIIDKGGELINFILKNKDNKTKLFFDIDDPILLKLSIGYKIKDWIFRSLLPFFNLVIVDTEEKKQYFKKLYLIQNIEIIPDTIDYDPVVPVQNLCNTDENKPLRLLWFGNIDNVHFFEKYISIINKIKDVKIVIITSEIGIQFLSKKFPMIECIKWNSRTFISDLRNCDVTFLAHDTKGLGSLKSNNKMITSITFGLPSITCNSIEYLKIAKLCNTEFYHFFDDSEIVPIVENLKNIQNRNEYLKKSQNVIWNNFSPNNIANKQLDIIYKYKNSNLLEKNNIFKFLKLLFIYIILKTYKLIKNDN